MKISLLARVPVLLLAVLLVAYSPGGSVAAETERPPNVLLILVDDVGREAVGCYGGETYPTPAIDALAKGGLKFDHFYTSPVCHPTRIALTTGRYLMNRGNPKWGYDVKGEAEKQTLAHELKKAGYATAAAGKWHMAMLKDDPQQPHRAGFDEYCFFGWHEGPRFWNPLIWQNGELREDTEKEFGPDLYREFLEDFMTRNRERPFFAYYPMALCHAVSDDLNPHPAHGPEGRYMTFVEMMAEMDKQVGLIVKKIEKLGLADDTLIFFVTDNGTTGHNFIRHEGRKLIREGPIVSVVDGKSIPGQKGKFTDWGIRVPGIAYWPGTIEAGGETGALADTTDFLPTLVELAGGEKPGFPHDGQSFAALLRGEEYAGREWIGSQTRAMTYVRTKDWKLGADGKLFDVTGAPFKERLIGEKDENEETRAARKKLGAWLKQTGADPHLK